MRAISFWALLLHSSLIYAFNVKVLDDICIKPYEGYKYVLCHDVSFSVDGVVYNIPHHFLTDLASLPRAFWPIASPAKSELIAPALIHDWLYNMTCDFSRQQADLIFYELLRQNKLSVIRASLLYYGVRSFGWIFYKANYCEDIP